MAANTTVTQDLARLLSTNPNHPKAKKYLQDLHDLMLIDLVTEIEMCEVLHRLIENKRIDELFKKIESKEQIAAAENAYQVKLHELTAAPASATKDTLQEKAKNISVEITLLTDKISVLEKYITAADKQIKFLSAAHIEKRNAVNKTLIDSITAGEYTSIGNDGQPQKITYTPQGITKEIDDAGNPILDKGKQKYVPTPVAKEILKPALATALQPIDLNQTDFKKAMTTLLANIVPGDTKYIEAMSSEMTKRENILAQIRVLACLGNGDPTPQEMVKLIQVNLKLGKLIEAVNDPNKQLNKATMTQILTLLKSTDEKKTELSTTKQRLEILNDALGIINQKIKDQPQQAKR